MKWRKDMVLDLSHQMQQRVDAGEVREEEVQKSTGRLFELHSELWDLYHNGTTRGPVKEMNVLGRLFLEHLNTNRQTIDLGAFHDYETLLERCAYLDIEDDADELDGIVYRSDRERKKDRFVKMMDHVLTPSQWNKEELKPWGKILAKALLEAGADPYLKAEGYESVSDVALYDMNQGITRVLLDAGIRLTDDGSRMGTGWQKHRTAMMADVDLDEIRVTRFQAFIDSRYDRAEKLWQQIEQGKVPLQTLNPHDIGMLSLIQKHHVCFEREEWRNYEAEAQNLLMQLPPFLQHELTSAWVRFSEPATKVNGATLLHWNANLPRDKEVAR